MKSQRTEDAGIYRRVSTKGQAKDGNSLEVQAFELKAFAAKNNLNIVEEFLEPGVSAKTTNRPQLLKMLDEALEPNPRFTVILIYSYSRLFRNADDATKYYYKLRDNGVRIIATTQPLPAEPEFAILMLQFIFAEDARLSKRLSMHGYSSAYRRFRNDVTSGPAPYGYSRDSDSKLQIVPDEAQIVLRLMKERAGELYTPDLTCQGRADILNAEGKTFRNGTPWTDRHIRTIESYFAYTGYFRAHLADSSATLGLAIDENMLLEIPAIVSKELYHEAARRRSEATPKFDGTDDMPNTSNLLSGGILLCGACGRRFAKSTGSSGKLKYYECSTQKTGGRASCTAPRLSLDATNKLVIEQIISTLFSNVNALPFLIGVWEVTTRELREHSSKIDKLTVDANYLAQKVQYHHDSYGSDKVLSEDPVLKANLTKISAEHQSVVLELGEATRRLRLLETRRPTEDSMKAFATVMSESLRAGDQKARNLVKLFVGKMVVTTDGILLEGGNEELLDAHRKVAIGATDALLAYAGVFKRAQPSKESITATVQQFLADCPPTAAHVLDPTPRCSGQWMFRIKINEISVNKVLPARSKTKVAAKGGREMGRKASLLPNRKLGTHLRELRAISSNETNSEHAISRHSDSRLYAWDRLPNWFIDHIKAAIEKNDLQTLEEYAGAAGLTPDEVLSKLDRNLIFRLRCGESGWRYPAFQRWGGGARVCRMLSPAKFGFRREELFLALSWKWEGGDFRGRSHAYLATKENAEAVASTIKTLLGEGFYTITEEWPFTVGGAETPSNHLTWSNIPTWLEEFVETEIREQRLIDKGEFGEFASVRQIGKISDRCTDRRLLSIDCGPHGTLLPTWQLNPLGQLTTRHFLDQHPHASTLRLYAALAFSLPHRAGAPMEVQDWLEARAVHKAASRSLADHAFLATNSSAPVMATAISTSARNASRSTNDEKALSVLVVQSSSGNGGNGWEWRDLQKEVRIHLKQACEDGRLLRYEDFVEFSFAGAHSILDDPRKLLHLHCGPLGLRLPSWQRLRRAWLLFDYLSQERRLSHLEIYLAMILPHPKIGGRMPIQLTEADDVCAISKILREEILMRQKPENSDRAA